MKVLRHRIYDRESEKEIIATIYEYHAKIGEQGSVLLWLFNSAVAGIRVRGIDESLNYSPYTDSQAFEYADWHTYYISYVSPDGIVYAERK